MAISANKVAPSLAVLAFVGYCVWPSVSEMIVPPEPPKPPEKIEDIPIALFQPTLPDPPTRNPWGGKDAATLMRLRKEAELAEQKEKESQTNVDADPSLQTATLPALSPEELLKSLTLGATCIGGNQRYAIINDHLYGLHELLRITTPNTPPAEIVEVRPHEVLLEYQGEILELQYSSTAAPSPDADDVNAVTASPEGIETSTEQTPPASTDATAQTPPAAEN